MITEIPNESKFSWAMAVKRMLLDGTCNIYQGTTKEGTKDLLCVLHFSPNIDLERKQVF
jgi:hypothetical protein